MLTPIQKAVMFQAAGLVAAPNSPEAKSLTDLPAPQKVLDILLAVESKLPLLKNLIIKLGTSPALTILITALVPEIAPLIPVIQEVIPFIDFLQSFGGNLAISQDLNTDKG